jgi:hypothetical protein
LLRSALRIHQHPFGGRLATLNARGHSDATQGIARKGQSREMSELPVDGCDNLEMADMILWHRAILPDDVAQQRLPTDLQQVSDFSFGQFD